MHLSSGRMYTLVNMHDVIDYVYKTFKGEISICSLLVYKWQIWAGATQCLFQRTSSYAGKNLCS